MLAIIRAGGKQYLVSPGQKIKIEKVAKKEGSEIIFKYKAKKRYKVKKGHRQPFTEVEIIKIES